MKRTKKSPTQDGNFEMKIEKNGNKRRGLILSGGGAKSIFQAQVVKRLRDAGCTFDVISGISTASLNAAMISQRSDDVVDTWFKVDKDDIFNGGFNAIRLFKILMGWKKSFYDNDGLERFLKRYYNPSRTKIPFIVGSVNLQTAEYNEFEITPNGDLTSWREEEIYKSIIASTSIPLVFPTIKHLGEHQVHLFADGGLRNITPLKTMAHKDVDEIVVVMCSPRHLGTTADNLNSPFKIAERSFDILLNEIVREDLDSVMNINRMVKQCNGELKASDGRPYREIDISLIEPRFGLGRILDFSHSIQKKRVKEANNVCDRILKR